MTFKLAIGLTLLSITLRAQVPSWVAGKGVSDEFPTAEYLTGLGIATLHKDSAQEIMAAHAYNAAKQDLVEQVLVKIQSATESFKQQDNDTYSALYTSTVASTSNLEIVGLQKQTYTDRRRKLVYAWAYAPKQDVTDHYLAKQKRHSKKLQQQFAEAKKCQVAGDRARAERLLLACRPLVSELNQAQSVLRSLGVNAETSYEIITAYQVEQALAKLVQGEANSLPDLVFVLVSQLNQNQEQPLSRVDILPPVYQQSSMASQFSQRFRTLLKKELINHAQWSIVATAGGSSELPSVRYQVQGNYEALGDRLAVNLYVWDTRTQEVISMATATLPQRVVTEAQLNFIPQQYAIRQGEQELFTTDKVLSHGIDLELWTNKGKEAQTFTEGETMDIFYRVNMPCYVRFIYHLADGQRVHFFDRQVAEAEVGQPLRVPYDFVCDCTDAPCGVETLQMNARETPLPELVTEEADGYAFITENLASIIDKNRVSSEDDQPNTYQAEQRLVITTMP